MCVNNWNIDLETSESKHSHYRGVLRGGTCGSQR